MRYAYLHGFASGPLAVKGQRLKAELAARGIDCALPDLNVPSFTELSVRAMLRALDALDEREGDEEGWGFFGSSLGGWLAARWTELHPERVPRLVLLCPAFDIPARWPEILPAGAFERWQAEGSISVPDGAGTPTPFHFRFYEEACEEPRFPSVSCPTLIVHGTRDDRVPIESSRAYVKNHPNVELLEVDDGHDLAASLDTIIGHGLPFLGVDLGRARP